MGFKDLVKFNEAILAKQVWRLMSDDNSLFCRVFKAKYFPRGSVFEASTSTGSYAWQSKMKARKVILTRMRWRLGDGKSIKIYEDNWLLGNGSTKIISPRVAVLEDATVDHLINSDRGRWNCNLINQNFLGFEAQ